MTASTDARIANMDGDSALPRKNGELVFQAPWEGRIFGLAVALSDGRKIQWDDFRARLIDEIAAAEASGADDSYYDRWLAAIERLLVEQGIVDHAELDSRTAACATEE